METPEEREQRFQSIISRLRTREYREQQPLVKEDLSAVLDAVGAMHLLETRVRYHISGWYGYGPIVRHAIPHWVGVVGWWRRNSFYSFERLKLLGIWSRQVDGEGDAQEIILGERELAFRGAFHNPESLHSQLRRDYRTYYAGDSSPPEKVILRLRYEASKRLASRLQLDAAITVWASALAAQSSRQ